MPTWGSHYSRKALQELMGAHLRLDRGAEGRASWKELDWPRERRRSRRRRWAAPGAILETSQGQGKGKRSISSV